MANDKTTKFKTLAEQEAHETLTGYGWACIPQEELWHRRAMEVCWTDTGKMFLRHELKDGGRISHPVEITPEMAKTMKDWMDG